MKLLTHNLLRSTVKQAKSGGYPLQIEATKVEVQAADFNAEFVQTMLDRLNWDAFCRAASQLAPMAGEVHLPSSVSAENKADEAFLQHVHHWLLEVVVLEGFLVCPDTGRKFKITNGIPNMLLRDDEL